MSFEEALRTIHFPETEEQLALAKRRLIFEELLLLQMGLLCEKTEGGNRSSIPIKNDYTEDFYSTIPFDPTNAQKRAISEAVEDMKTDKQMNRLLQGDVGSGKTAVAAALMYNAVKNGFQAALMAPTEVLANQHFKTLSNFFGDDINICLLTGSVTAAKKRDIRERLKDGDCDIVVGTHAIIQNDVEFNNLGLVITDEQHRFGVGQRASLSNKGNNPHTGKGDYDMGDDYLKKYKLLELLSNNKNVVRKTVTAGGVKGINLASGDKVVYAKEFTKNSNPISIPSMHPW